MLRRRAQAGGHFQHTGRYAMSQITDEKIEALRRQVGIEIPCHNPWNREASADGIRHFAWGIGDDNPLWLDEGYAGGSIWGSIIAPPTFLSTCSHGPAGPGAERVDPSPLAGIHGFRVGDRWDWAAPVPIGTRIQAVERLADVQEKYSSTRGKMVLVRRETVYREHTGREVATHTRIALYHERGVEKAADQYAGIEPWVYTPEELDRIEGDYAREKRRGAFPRWWDDVAVGDDLGHVTKGPLTATSLVTYWMGWGLRSGMTDKIAHDYMREHPEDVLPHRTTNVPDLPDRAHMGDPIVRELGFPLGYDVGTQRVAWLAHLVTNWQGDAGVLTSLSTTLRSPNWLGDTTWIRGTVVEKLEPSEHDGLVRLELWGENQRGQRHVSAEATVRLPRAGGKADESR